MVLCNLQLISLRDGISVGSFLAKLRRNSVKPVVQARFIRWMILPTQLSAGYLLGRNIRWDLLLILEENDAIPHEAQLDIDATWSAASGVSSKAISNYAVMNAELLRPAPGSVKPPEKHTVEPSRTSQNLEMSPELDQWITALPAPLKEHPVSMLNLLAFNPGKKDQYKQYGAEFSAKVGSKHGGQVKIVGRVVGGQAQRDGWEEIAFVHYPSVRHFASMAASKDYQDVNHNYRLGALRDTFICCVMEVDDDSNISSSHSTKGKL
ncbi:uncharacterized protein F4812DRAFT_451460 [Daldinia caldariorum]|uniref:uncharacterized protein n=1 Tax=Daldinia caldariorum TaxID=326644 RepID=UPI002007CCDA|nr:uncharacterized protein F4812DRAFT_451460 [Daldinia caldariorum]KAI1467136.1 hypothetical protein F4812DRAFT_451460 [Daldinia caldariorum]